MATDTTHLPQGDLNNDASNDMAGSELEFGAVQLAQVDSGQPVQLPQGQQVVLIPVQPGQTLTLPTDSPNGLLAKIGPEGNLAIVVDGRTIIFQGYVQANDQSPVRLVTSDGDQIDVADVVAATDTSLDIQTAAGPAAGAQGDSAVGSGIYTPFAFGPALGGLNAIGVLDATALAYKLIDDKRETFVQDEDERPRSIDITFDELGGIINEDDLTIISREIPNDVAALIVAKDNGHDGDGNDEFDGNDREDEPGDVDGTDGNPDPDREPLVTIATAKVDFHGDVPGTLAVDPITLPAGLTSEGELIIYDTLPAGVGHGNGIVAFVDGNGNGKFDDDVTDRVVFDVKVQEASSNSIFHIAFTLYDNIDNAAPDLNGDGAADLLGGNEQILGLPVKVTATDSTSQSLSAVMNLGVEDDIPFFGEAVDVGEGFVSITPGDSTVIHDESKFPQGDADDQSIFDPQASSAAFDAGQKVVDAGFGLPYGDSVGSLFGIAQKQVLASFGADGRSNESAKDADDSSARNSIFGELQDRLTSADGVNDGENELPFELFMIDPTKGSTPAEDNVLTGPDEGNLTIDDQPTNATVTWNGQEPPLQVFLRQIDATTIVGYVIPPEGEEPSQEARALKGFDSENGEEAVFVLTIDQDGVLTFVQYHQINHDVDGPSGPDHDDTFVIMDPTGETAIVHVRISDYDGDHATQPVGIEIQDDGPKFCGVDWGCDNDSKNGKGLIDEDKLYPNGNNDWAPGDDKGGKHADGKINFDTGVDKPGHLEVHGLKVTDSAGVVLMNITVSFDEDSGEYVASGPNDLKTADGHPIEIEVSVDGNGLLTLIGRDSEDGSEAFKYTLQTTGYDKGEFDFCLNEPLYHPYHDSDYDNTGYQKSFEDNLKFDLNVRGYDVDGDWADGNICINVDDDSPKAECDYECVVEGTHGEGELNYVTGNIITGNGDTIFGNDANNLDGNADSPGADQPYTISKISHGGNTYELSADHQSVSGLGADDEFDPATGILTIKTAEGGTLEIVLVSNNQDEVGDYKYTVPADADHDHDIHAGPADEAASLDFDQVDEWVDSFAAAGITLIPGGGDLGVRLLDVSGPEYRGIGVGSSEGDNNEVDNNGPDEKLTLQIANPTNNIELTIGALYNGGPDAGAMENLRWEAWNGGILVASGEILGTTTGLVTLDIDTLVPFNKIVLLPADNGQGESPNNSDFVLVNAEICCPKDKFTEEFDYTLRDADGDEACATLKVDVKDTEPTREHGQPLLTAFVVDEDGLPKGVHNTDSPFDDNEDHSAPNAPVDDAKHIGTIPFTPGADPTSIELTVLGGPNTGMKTLDNQRIFATWDSVTGTLIGYIEGTDPAVAANQIFKMHITDPLTGSYEFELLQPVKHENSELFGIIDDTENLANLPASFIVVAEIEDKDCDVLFSKVLVTIDDDMPVITECHDEQGKAINLLVNGSFEQLGTEDGGVLEQGGGTWGVFSKIPGWTSGHDADPSKAGIEIQNNGALGSIDAQQGNQYLELDSDQLNPGDPNPATTNASVHQDVNTQDGNDYVLSFFYSPREGNPASDGIEVWFDGQLISTINSGTVGQWTEYKFVVQAGEGDGTPDLSRLEFKAVGTANELGGFIDNVSLTACALVDEDQLPNGIEGGPGDDGVIGTTFNGSLGVNFGADGGKSIAFLTSGQPNLKSGGANVQYTWVPAAGGLGTLIAHTGNVANPVFKVEVTSLEDGGQYTFTLLRPLDHPDTNDNPADNKTDDGKGSFEDNLIFELGFKATDRDDDTVKGHLQVNVDDDSPLITVGEGSISLHTDETLGGSGDAAGGGTRIENDEFGAVIPGVISGQVAGTVIGFSQGGAAGLFSGQYGADGPGSTTYALTILGTGATGLTDTATGTAITLVAGSGGVILGKNAGGDVVFAFSIDASGNVTMVQYRAVNHGAEEAAPGEHDEVIHFIENALGVTAKITDKDGDSVSLTRDISASISIDDDGPQANNDYDSVKEGPGNFAAGNVVTGGDAALLGIDANLTDGTADNPGQDKPHTISKLTHDGHTYLLSADGSTVTKDGGALGAGETFAGGVLKINTAEGGTLEIVLKSATQSEVGEYKYTPGNPIHAEDVHVGPTVAQSNTAAFDTIGEWTSAFTAGGITLTATGGALTIKTIDVPGPNDYRGVGVNTGIDNGEVDTDGEKLTLTFDGVKFPGGVNNAEVQIGAFFDGVNFDAGSQEVLRWEAYNGGVLVASGQIVGDLDGLVTLDIDTATNFNKIVLTPLNNGAGDNGNNSDFVVLNVEVCKQEPVCEEFGYTLRDGDGDESSATLKINVEDTQPTIPTQTPTLSFLVDEDGITGGNKDGAPFDANETDGVEDGKFSGNIPFTPGADPVTVELYVGEPGQAGGGDTGLDTVDGKNVYAAWDAATKTLIGYIQGTDPSDAANRVFTMHITNDQTGAFDFQLFKPIEHPNTDAGGANNNTENATDLSFTVNVQIEDADCDVAFTTVKVTIDDDMPTIEANYCGSILLAVDETLGGGSDVAPNPGTTRENDEAQFNMPDSIDDVPGSPIGAAQANAAVLFNINPGADGLESGSTEYNLVILNGGFTGLIDTATGNEVRLYANGPDGIIVGRAGNSSAAIVLAFDINEDTGQISMAQFRAVNHGADQVDGPLGNHDEVTGFTKSALGVQVSVQDKDQDTVTSEPRDISSMITIDDDGPKITKFRLEHDAKLTVDETVGGSPNDNDETKSAGDANDIGFATIKAGDLFDADFSYGTDGAAKSNSAVVSLVVVGGDGTASGLVDSKTDQNIVLITKPDGSVEGHVGSGAGDLAFIIKTTSGGDVTVSQYRAVEHDNPNDNDESSSPEIMDSNKVLLQLTVTDGDGDKAQQSLDLGAIIKFEDDGPKANPDVDSITEDSAEHAIGNVITPANVTPFGSDSNATDGVADAPGSDGLKSITWTNVVDAADDYVQGAYGKLYVDAAGNYKYDLDESNPALATLDNGETLQEIFNYTIKDGDDDKSSSTLTITINGKTDAFPPEAANVTATVDEDALPNGNTGNGYNSTGDDNANSGGDTDPNEAIYHNTLGIDWKGTPGDIALTAGDWSALRTIDNHTIIVDPASTENLLIGRDSVTNEKVFEVQIINETTGEYEVRLLKPLMHPDSNNNPADNATDFGQGSYEDNLTIPVNVKYTSIGGSIDRVLSIDVDDDSPKWSLQITNEVTQDDETTPLPGYTGIPGATVGSDTGSTATGGTFSVNGVTAADGIESFALDLNATAAANSGLRATDGTADGASIVYTLEGGGDVVGRIGDGSLLNTEVFRFHSNGDGTYTFTRSSPLFHTGQGEINDLAVKAVIKVTDRDGDAFTYPHTFFINDDMPSVTISTANGTPTLVLDESRPVGTETDGDSDPAGKQTVTVDFAPNFNAAFGADGAADTGSKSYSLDLTGGPNVASGLYALTADGIGQGTQIVLNKVGNDIVGSANGDTYFTIKVDADGKVTFEQAKNVWHADAGNDDDTSFLHTDAAGALKLTLTLKDGDNDTASASIDLGHDKFQIEDDGPKAENDNVVAAPGVAGTADIVFIVDVSGSMTDGGGSIVVPNVPDFDDNRLGLARYSMQQLLLGHPEILNVQFVMFDDGVSSTVWMSRADALTFIGTGPGDGNFVGGGTTNYDIALQEAMDEYAASPRPEGQAEQTLVYFLSDGAPNTPDSDPGITGNGGGSNVSVTEWETFVSNPANDITNVFALGLGGSANAGNLAPVSYPNTDTGAPGEDNVVLIPDANLAQLTQTLDDLLGDVLTPVTGDVTTNDSFGTDGPANPELVSVTYNAVTYTFGAPDNEYTINLGAGRGTLKIKNDGTYTYTPPATEGADGNPFQVEYKIRDRDGDTSTANIIIDLTTPPTTNNVFAAGDEDAVAGIPVVLTGSDSDGSVVEFKITSLPANGTLYADAGLTNPISVGEVVSAVINTSTVYFVPNANYSGPASFHFTAIDNSGAEDGTPAEAQITVNPVNDAPVAVITQPSYAATEQVNLNLHNTGLSISDIDAGNGNVTVTLAVAFGTLTVVAGNSGILNANISGNGTGSVTITGTVAQINLLLAGTDTGPGSGGTIVYNANSDTPPASTQLTLHVEDNGNTGSGGNLSGIDQVVTINITATGENPVGVTDRIYTNISSLITVQDSLLLKNDTDADTAHAALVIASANAGGNGDYFDTDPSHAGTSVTFELDIDGGTSFSNGTTKSFTYVVGDPTLTDDGTVNVTYDTSGSINGSDQDDILIGLNVGLNGKAGADHMIGTGTTDLLDYSNVGSDWNLTLGAGGSGNANIDGADTYEGIDGIIGGSGKNELTGNDGNNILNGGGGDDKLTGGLGTDTLNGDAGNDTLVYDSQDTHNGGANSDILDVSHLASVNFTGFTDSKIESIETLSLSGGSGTTVTLTAADVINFEPGSFDPSGTDSKGNSYSNVPMLTITGEAGDSVNLTSGAGDAWFNASANGAGGVPAGFTLYVHVTSGTNPGSNEDAYVLVQNGVSANLS